MQAALVQFVASSLVVALAAVMLTKFTDRIATITGMGRLFVGSIFLAAATSIPEFAININAVRLELPDIAMGGLIGSSLFNLLILAVADLSNRSRGAVFSRSAVEHAMPGVVSIAMTAILGIGMFVEVRLTGFQSWLVGPTSIALLIAYLLGVRMIYIDQKNHGVGSKQVGEKPDGRQRTQVIFGYLACAGVIVLVAPFLASAAGEIAEKSGLGNTFVGTTFVALSTSLPELVACTSAARMGAIDLAIGNVFGSNTFNLTIIVMLDLLTPGSLAAGVSAIHLLTCLFVCLTTSVVILGQLYRIESRTMVIEPDAAVVVLMVVVALVLIYLCR